MASRFPSSNNQLGTSFNLRNQATIQDGSFTVQQVKGDKVRVLLVLDKEHLAFLGNPGIPYGQATQTTIPQNAAFKTDDLDAYDSDYDDISSAKAVLMANLLSYEPDILFEQCNLLSSVISFLLAVGTFFTSSGNFSWQWELHNW
nr:hypothetical protein [Tanacetum cinerariifolium]